MEKNRAPPPLPHQKIENQNVSKTEEQHEKNIDVSIQNDKRFEGLKIETIQKSDENATISKAAEQLEDIIDPQTQDEFGLPCIRDMPNNALATLVDVAGQQSKIDLSHIRTQQQAQAAALMAMASNPKAAHSLAAAASASVRISINY